MLHIMKSWANYSHSIVLVLVSITILILQNQNILFFLNLESDSKLHTVVTDKISLKYLLPDNIQLVMTTKDFYSIINQNLLEKSPIHKMFNHPDCFKPSKYYIYTFKNMYTNGLGAMHNGSHWIQTPKTVEGRMDYWFDYAEYKDGPIIAYLNYALDVGFCFLNFYGDFVHHAFSYIYLIPESIRKEITIVCAQSPSKSTLKFICNIFEMPDPIITNQNIVYVHNLLYMIGPHSWQTHYGEIMQNLTEFLRQKMKLDQIPITKYAFINRELGKSRRIKNLEEICNEAKKICPYFEYIDLNIYRNKMNVEETAKLWASLKFVVHHGGSGFSNCIFVKKGVLKAVIIHCTWYDYPAINFLITCEAKVISIQFDHIQQWSTEPSEVDPNRVLSAVEHLYKEKIKYNFLI